MFTVGEYISGEITIAIVDIVGGTDHDCIQGCEITNIERTFFIFLVRGEQKIVTARRQNGFLRGSDR